MKQSDTSTSSISTPINSISSKQHQQIEGIPYMDRDSLRAAQNGDMELFNKYQGDLHCLVDGRQNTALHIYSRTGEPRRIWRLEKSRKFFSMNFVKELVHKCPSLLLQPNIKGEIPLHVAAKHGNAHMVESLIELAKEVRKEDLENGLEATCKLKQMLRMTDKDGNTALHKAVESGDYLDVVRLLVKELHPDFSLSANKRGETPLYIASMTKRSRSVAEILDNWKSTNYDGPHGRTALHAAVIAADQKSVRKLIEANKHLTKVIDDNGQTPLHYAAHYGCRSIVKELLESNASTAYITDKVGGMTALHIAAWRNMKDIMEDIISYCPGCCEIVDKRGWNFLHFACATLELRKLRKFIFCNNKINDLPIRDLINEKDVKGNTPFHVLIFRPDGKQTLQYSLVAGALQTFRSESEDCVYIYSSLETKKKQIEKELEDLVNDAEATRLPILYSFEKSLTNERGKVNIGDKARESHLLVATLITTVTFAASFTVPGGYNEQQGTAALIRDSAFRTFIVTNTLAFVASLLAIFLHFLLVVSHGKMKSYIAVSRFNGADELTLFAMAAMVIAFSSGTYAVLDSSSKFAITALCFGLIFFPCAIFCL